MSRKLLLPALIAVALFAASCGSPASSSNSSGGSGGALNCTSSALQTHAPGTLTIGTDNPAYDPYFTGPAGGQWKGKYNHDPTAGQGFEDAVAYAVAQQLGYTREKVAWTALNWKQSFKPGPKDFDFYLAQVSISPKRQQSADFSVPYYTSTQAIVAKPGSPIAQATSLADLKSYQFGTESGTTSYDDINAVIAPTNQPKVYDTTNDVTQALSNGQIDGLVTDFPSAYYIANVEPGGLKIVGQFTSGSGADTWGLVLAKDSPLTACVNKALAQMKTSGKLQAIEQQWLANLSHAP
ncbi:MAG TPA: ABC transporter substrate-binding protein, partial [Gaiellales bacterium]|nr:ABC transporter substrate-binding protein [Gaiellales bacterium]